MIPIKTGRLILRPWKQEDLEPFAKLNADPRVMKYFLSTLSEEQSLQMVQRIQINMQKRGWGLWAVEVPGVADFIGFIGLNHTDDLPYIVPFAPGVEIGWRLAFDFWNKGYATEGAKAVLEYGFNTLNLEEIVSFTAAQNKPSRHVMEKIGMHCDPNEFFNHPKAIDGHPLAKTALYRLTKNRWELL